jgi:hypothetical protein
MSLISSVCPGFSKVHHLGEQFQKWERAVLQEATKIFLFWIVEFYTADIY